jgi:cob(I)alamin adenosyltransferase
MNSEKGTSGRVLLFTGDGKGKTTAALGMALRACGHGQKILVVQFIKQDPGTGEIKGCAHLPGVKVVQAGRGFVPHRASPDFPGHKKAAEEALALAAAALGEYQLLVLDEICVAVSKGLLEEGRVAEVVRRAPPETCIVLTGRPVIPGLVSLADTVTEMRAVKHLFQAGGRAQEGVEY